MLAVRLASHFPCIRATFGAQRGGIHRHCEEERRDLRYPEVEVTRAFYSEAITTGWPSQSFSFQAGDGLRKNHLRSSEPGAPLLGLVRSLVIERLPSVERSHL